MRKLIFGRGYKKDSNKDKKSRKPKYSDKKEDDNPSTGSSSQGSQVELSATEETAKDENQLALADHEQGNAVKKPGHGRMPHSVYM